MTASRASHEELLREALEIPAGARIALQSREPFSSGSISGFRVRVEATETLYYVDTSGRPVAAETGLVQGPLSAPEARVWRHPADPHLPALAPVAFSDAAAVLLGRLGLVATTAPRMVSYRPGRRSVLSIDTDRGPRWLKVVRPSRVGRIVGTHRDLAAAGIPLPTLCGWSGEGLLVFDDAEGVPAAHANWRPGDLLAAVDDLRERLARAPASEAVATRMTRRLAWYDERLTTMMPAAEAAEVGRLVAHARAEWAAGDAPVTVHGDLHFGQLFLDDDGTGVRAVIDVDTAGRGVPAEDTGAFLAHAVASAVLTVSPHDERLWALAREAMVRWEAAPVRGSRPRAVAHLLGHLLGALDADVPDRAHLLLRAARAVSAGDADALGSG